MLTMGNTHSVRKINFEDMQDMIRDNKTIIVNTLDISNQECLIKRTISASDEVNIINELIKSDYANRVVIYGMNSADESIVRKYNQLTSLDLKNGNNTNIVYFRTNNNNQLYCIDVDDSYYSTSNWNEIDPQHYFSEDCP